MEQNPQPEDLATGSDENSLEAPATIVEPDGTETAGRGAPPDSPEQPDEPGASDQADKPPVTSSPSPKQRLRWLRHINIYLLIFIIIIIAGGALVLAAYLTNQRDTSSTNLSSQNLSSQSLQQLANSDTNVGSNGQVLNVQSSAIFAGKVLVRQDLEVAGNLALGGTLALSNITANGTGQFGQANVNQNLTVGGTSALQGPVTIAKSLQVNGNGSFNGPLSAPQVTTSSLQLNGDLVLTHHITTGGALPGRSPGGALGSGGTASLSGSDTSGSITVNTGGGPVAGCFISVSFSAKYSSTPHVLLTPVGASAGGLAYYVTRSASGFSVCDASSPPANASFGFDYFVVD